MQTERFSLQPDQVDEEVVDVTRTIPTFKFESFTYENALNDPC